MSAPQIIRNYMILAALYTLAASLIWSVNTLFLSDAGPSIGQGASAVSAAAGMTIGRWGWWTGNGLWALYRSSLVVVVTAQPRRREFEVVFVSALRC